MPCAVSALPNQRQVGLVENVVADRSPWLSGRACRVARSVADSIERRGMINRPWVGTGTGSRG